MHRETSKKGIVSLYLLGNWFIPEFLRILVLPDASRLLVPSFFVAKSEEWKSNSNLYIW